MLPHRYCLSISHKSHNSPLGITLSYQQAVLHATITCSTTPSNPTHGASWQAVPPYQSLHHETRISAGEVRLWKSTQEKYQTMKSNNVYKFPFRTEGLKFIFNFTNLGGSQLRLLPAGGCEHHAGCHPPFKVVSVFPCPSPCFGIWVGWVVGKYRFQQLQPTAHQDRQECP